MEAKIAFLTQVLQVEVAAGVGNNQPKDYRLHSKPSIFFCAYMIRCNLWASGEQHQHKKWFIEYENTLQ